MIGGRPRKTAEELDAEMNDYWGGAGEGTSATNANAAAAAGNGGAGNAQGETIPAGENAALAPSSAVHESDDIDLMIE